jgi:hypothetical protein
MAELIQPFWLASARLNGAVELPAWLKSINVKTQWLDEVVWITGKDGTPPPSLPGLEKSALVLFEFQNEKINQMALLQDACRKIETGDRDMVLLVLDMAAETIVVVLSSPSIVGRNNLMPQAYLDARVSEHLPAKEADIFGLLDAGLNAKEKSAGQLNFLAFVSPLVRRPAKTDTPFAKAAWIKQDENTLGACHELVASLAAGNKKQGLAVEIDTLLDLHAIWIEGL